MYEVDDMINIYEIPFIPFSRAIKESIIKHEERYYFNHKKLFEIKIFKELYLYFKEFFRVKDSFPTKLYYDYSKYLI